jgi:hypothetical protein
MNHPELWVETHAEDGQPCLDFEKTVEIVE